MMPVHFFRKLIFLGMTIALLCGASAGFSAEKPNEFPLLRELDIDACEPVRYQAKITEVNRAKGTLTVAEKEICLLDVSANEKRLSTALLDLDGKAAPFTAFKKSDLVLIEGFAHPKGFVAASKIQKIQAVTERKNAPRDSAARTPKRNGQSNQPK
jgi:hypothetical protein